MNLQNWIATVAKTVSCFPVALLPFLVKRTSTFQLSTFNTENTTCLASLAARWSHASKFKRMRCKQNVTWHLWEVSLRERGHTLSPVLLRSAAWKIDVIAGAVAASLDSSGGTSKIISKGNKFNNWFISSVSFALCRNRNILRPFHS